MISTTEVKLIYLNDSYCYFLSQELVDCCERYTKQKSYHNNYLCNKRNADPLKIEKQDAYSKACEFIAYKWLKEELKVIKEDVEIDTSIYDPLKKSWSEDIGTKFAVKSTVQRNAAFVRRGTDNQSSESWTFQFKNKYGPGGFDENIFGLTEEQQSDKYIIFITIEDDIILKGTKVWIRGMVRLSHLHKYNLFKDPIANKLKGLKKNIYDGDLKELQTILLLQR